MDVRLKLQSARHTEGPFTSYFMRQVVKAKYLQPPYPAKLLIKTIARGYPPNISAVLVGVEGFDEAMDRLRQADYYFRTEEKVYFNKSYKDPVNPGKERYSENDGRYPRPDKVPQKKFQNYQNQNQYFSKGSVPKSAEIRVLEVERAGTDNGGAQEVDHAGNDEVPREW